MKKVLKYTFYWKRHCIKKENDIVFLKIKNNTRLKKCLINELGFSSFYWALYSPNYVCYLENEKENEKEKKLIIEINLYGKEKESFTLDNPKRPIISSLFFLNISLAKSSTSNCSCKVNLCPL